MLGVDGEVEEAEGQEAEEQQWKDEGTRMDDPIREPPALLLEQLPNKAERYAFKDFSNSE